MWDLVNKALLHAILAAIPIAGCGGSSPQPVLPPFELTVGAMLPGLGFSGATPDFSLGVQLAVSDMNTGLAKVNDAQKGAWRKPITFRIEARNVLSDEVMSYDLMNELSAFPAKVVVTESSNTSIGANKWNYQEIAAGKTDMIPLVSFTSTSASLNNPAATDPDPIRQAALVDAGDWFFRTTQTSDILAPIRIAYMFHRGPLANGDVDGDGVIKIVWLGTNDVSTQSVIAADQSAVTTYVNDPTNRAAPLITRNVSFNTPASPDIFDYTNVIADALSASDGHAPDLIINKTLISVAIPLVQQYTRANSTVQILEDGTFRRNSILASLGTAGDGQLGLSNIGYESSASGVAFAAEQSQLTGWSPAVFEAQGYDAMIMALLAVLKASQQVADPPTQVTAALVRDNLKTLSVPITQDPNRLVVTAGVNALADAITAIIANPRVNINYDGASGPVDFDAVGDVRSRVAVWRIQGGQFVEQTIYDCVTSPACPQTPREPGLTPR